MDEEEILHVVSKWTGIPVEKMLEDPVARLQGARCLRCEVETVFGFWAFLLLLLMALAYGNVPVGTQLLRESLVGSLIGGAIGLLAGLGLWIWDGRPAVGCCPRNPGTSTCFWERRCVPRVSASPRAS